MPSQLCKQDNLSSTLSLRLQISQSDSAVFSFPQNRKRPDRCPANTSAGMPSVCGGTSSWLMVTETLGGEQTPELRAAPTHPARFWQLQPTAGATLTPQTSSANPAETRCCRRKSLDGKRDPEEVHATSERIGSRERSRHVFSGADPHTQRRFPLRHGPKRAFWAFGNTQVQKHVEDNRPSRSRSCAGRGGSGAGKHLPPPALTTSCPRRPWAGRRGKWTPSRALRSQNELVLKLGLQRSAPFVIGWFGPEEQPQMFEEQQLACFP